VPDPDETIEEGAVLPWNSGAGGCRCLRPTSELTSTVRASTTGMLYVLDEPSVGLHPSNVTGLRAMISALVGNGNSMIVVERERDRYTCTTSPPPSRSTA
jgi:hypothetical protein